MADHPVGGGDGQAREEVVPQASEHLHLPGPSYQPVVVAAGLTLALVGVVISPIMLVIGLIVTVVVILRWVRESREEIADLPLEH